MTAVVAPDTFDDSHLTDEPASTRWVYDKHLGRRVPPDMIGDDLAELLDDDHLTISSTGNYSNDEDRRSDVESKAARFYARYLKVDPDERVCARMQAILSKHSTGARKDMVDGHYAAVCSSMAGHTGLAATLQALSEVREGANGHERDVRRSIEGAYKRATTHRDKGEEECACPGTFEKLEKAPKPAPEDIDDNEPPSATGGGEEQIDPFAEAVEAAVRAQRISRTARRLLDAEERGTPPPPASTSLRELLAEEPNTTKYRIDGLWPSSGKVLVTAAKKSGKTTMIGNLVRCLVDGDRFLGKPYSPTESTDGVGFAVTADERSVFVLDFEMTRDMLREWLRAQQIDAVDRVHVELMRGRTLDLRDNDVRGQWAAHLRSLDVGTLIIDPIGPVIHGLGIDENDNSQVGAFLTAIDKLCLEAGVAEYAVVHHAGHGEEQRARGASAFVGWPDAWWQITRSEDGSFLRAEGRDVALDETALVFNSATRHLTLGEGSRRDARGSADITAVIDMVTGNPGATRNDLAKLLRESDGWGTERARAAIAAAVKAGSVHHHRGANRAHFHHLGAACERCPVLEVD